MVFACSTLRQLGRIILPVVSIDHYRHAQKLAAHQAEETAYRQVFGLTPLELSRELLRGYKLPEEVRHSLGDNSSGDSDPHSAHDERLGNLVDYGAALTQIVLDASLDTAGYERETGLLATRFARSIPNAHELLTTTLGATSDRLTQFLQIPGASSGTEVMLRRIRERLFNPAETGEPVTRPVTATTHARPTAASIPPIDPTLLPASASPKSTAPFPTKKSASVPPQPPPAPEPVLEAITLMPEPVQPVVPGEPWLEVLRPVRGGFEADHCVIFLRASTTGPFVLSGGLGSFAAHYQDIAAVHPDEKTVFSIALARRETVVIHDARTASLRPFLPAWFQDDAATPSAFLLVPLAHGDRVDSLVLIGWAKARRIELNAGHEAMLHLLRASANQLAATQNRSVLPRKVV
jgi:hypothetical protein